MTIFRDRNGRPILPLGLQTHNSSTGVPEMLEREIAAVKHYGGNLLEAPVYWYRIEKEPGCYDYADADDLIRRCRMHGLHLILLWFGVNKNGHPNYAPEWVKTHPEIYAVAQGRDGGRVASMSPLCDATLEADSRAFAAFMAHLRQVDGEERTVIAVQVENEIGLANTDMDYRVEAQEIYRQPVPEKLRNIVLEDSGVTPWGDTWRSRFGRHAHEAFMAWAHAEFVEKMALAGKAEYDLPLMINVMLGEQGFEEAGLCYNSGAAVGRVLDIYKAAAPHIDLICPDMYVPDRLRYRRVCGRYARPDNPLFIPESPIGGVANALNMMEAFADYGCIGMACFGAGRAVDMQGNLLDESREMALSMRTVANLAPLILKYRGTGRIHALVQQEFMDKQYLRLDGYHVEAKFISATGSARWGMGSFLNPAAPENADIFTARGRALLIQTDAHEFYLAGCGVKVDFRRRPDPMAEDSFPLLASRQCGTLNFLSVEEGHFEGEEWVCDRVRNGDESNFELFSHRGQAVRIRLNPN
ncbi:MAG: DUF5597 domain-containing protein [Clostridia bacterium]|nr:DUF5597 domain-containing protein [Clostridia bacterium]